MDESLEKKIWQMFEQGLSDNEILDALVSQEGESLTYMELRVLRADYEEEHPETIEMPEVENEEDTGDEKQENPEPEDVVTLDTIKKPGALLSGKGNLPSGARISWMLDQMGRINIIPEGSPEPTQDDLQVFQNELRNVLQRSGGML